MIKESVINKIDALTEKVNEIIDDGDEFKGYKASPLLKEILDLLEENNDKEQDTLKVQYDAYRFVAETYKMMGRFSLAARYHEKALDASIVLYHRYNDKMKDVDTLLYDVLKERNYYIDDDGLDVLAKIRGLGLLDKQTIDKINERVMSHRRGLKNDPVEMSEAYLAVIDEIEEKIDKKRTIFGMGACFEIWNLKAEFLAEKGIIWTSPALQIHVSCSIKRTYTQKT